MKMVSTRQIQELDRLAIVQHGIPSLELMERAGQACVSEILNLSPQRVTVISGVGNNGGDGLVIARLLRDKNVHVDVFVIGTDDKFSSDAQANYLKLNKDVLFIEGVTEQLKFSLSRADVVVDAVFGVGLSREIKDPFRAVIDIINVMARYIVSVDIPSGLDGTTGTIYGICIRAHKTVTFTFIKKGMDASPYCGAIVIADIGIPDFLKEQI